MSETQSKITLFGTRGSPSAYQIRDFLRRCDVPFEYVELRTNEQARKEAQLEALNDPRLPVCVVPDGPRMERPTLRQIIERLGWFQNPSRTEYDLSIYGAGPAGLSAAVYGASEGLKTVLVERFALGGQAGSSPKIENGHRPPNWPIDRDPYYLETNMPGVFAAGDVRHNSVKRCASAVGEGAMAVTLAQRYITNG